MRGCGLSHRAVTRVFWRDPSSEQLLSLLLVKSSGFAHRIQETLDTAYQLQQTLGTQLVSKPLTLAVYLHTELVNDTVGTLKHITEGGIASSETPLPSKIGIWGGCIWK